MLQRAASNAYSWWWASHIRTKQSKWLEQSLQDMEEKTQHVLGLIQEEGDSFAKRAEMYYKRRPELISCVEESYRAFRALAERYDHISTELQNANNTLATCFPEQFQMPMDEDDDPDTPRTPRFPMQVPPSDPSNVPKVPNLPMKNFKSIATTASKQLKHLKTPKVSGSDSSASKSGLSKNEAIEEIDKLHKDILALQTVKEFVKSSYQSGLEKYYDIENIIMEKQKRVCELQDEFGVQKVIEDDEARKLMAEAALKSCQETLSHLQETQQKSAKEAKEEGKKIEDARQRINSIRNRYLPDKTDAENLSKKDESIKKEANPQEKLESIKTGDATPRSSKGLGEIFQDKIKFQLDVSSMSSITVTQLAEKIDELVTKVITLENAVSSQNILIERLRSEAHELHGHIQTLEDDKTDLTGGTEGLSKKVKELEEKLRGVQDLNRNVESQSSNLETHFADAQFSLNNLSDKLTSVQPDEEPQDDRESLKESVESVSPSQDQAKPLQDIKPTREDQEKQKEQNSTGSIEVSHHSGTGDVNAQVHPDISTSKKGQEEEAKSSQEQEEVAKSSQGHPDISTSKKGQEEEAKSSQGHPDISTSKKGQEEEAKSSQGQEKVAKSSQGQEEEAKSPTKKEVTVDPDMKDNVEQQTTTADEKSDETKDFNEGKEKDDLNWQLMLLDGDEDREKILIKEYTTILRNYKDVKKKLNDVETKNKHGQHDISMQFKELNCAIAKRDGMIQKLRHKLNEMQGDDQKIEDASTDKEGDDDLNIILSGHSSALSPVEETLRADIDSILDENLGFWLRFSAAFSQIQKFKTTVEDLQGEILQIRDKKQEGNYSKDKKSEVRPLYKHLKEIQAELAMWLEKCTSLKEEMERRFSSLCSIQEKIGAALKESVEQDDIIFSSHQAAKFQGEVLNMKQENNRVKEELKAGFDHITILKDEVDSTLTKLTDEFGLSGNNPTPLSRSSSRSKVPLKSFLFGSKPRQKRHSIFSLISPSKKYQALRAGLPP